MYFLTEDDSSKRRDRIETLNGFPVKRVIRAYYKEGEHLISEFSLEGVSLSELRDLFGESKQNLMVDNYLISSTQASYFQKRLNTAFNFDTFDYFLECDAV